PLQMNLVREIFHKIAGLDVSWVGECPWTGTLCFGGEDGRLVFLPGPRSAVGSGLRSIQPATDTINAVTFAGEFIAVSSRNEVHVGRRICGDNPRVYPFPHSFIGGAHGIVAAHTGAFLAPIGDQGLLILRLGDWQANAQIGWHRDVPLNFY